MLGTSRASRSPFVFLLMPQDVTIVITEVVHASRMDIAGEKEQKFVSNAAQALFSLMEVD